MNGPATPGPGLKGPSTAGPSAPTGRRGGAFTKKTRTRTTPSFTWQYWWARNQYQFLDFPEEELILNNPITPTANPDRSRRAQQERLRSTTIEGLRRFLDDDSARLRQAALISLGRLQDKESIPKMVAMLQDGNLSVRSSAVLALGLCGGGKARYILLNVAKNTDSAKKLVGDSTVSAEMRSFAEALLALTGSMGAEATLQSIAQNASCNIEVRAMALEGLGLLGGEKSVSFLAEFSQVQKTDFRLLSAAVCALGKTESPVAVPLLQQHLKSKHNAVRQSAALGLGRAAPRGDEIAVKHLFRCFSQTTDRVLKGFALVSIGQIGGPEALRCLRLVLSRGTSADLPWVCLGLGIALRNAPQEKVPLNMIEELTKCGNRSTQGAVAIGLGLARSREAVKELTRLIKEGDEPYLRGYCAMALGLIGDHSSVEPLREALACENNPPLQTQSALALSLLDDRHSVPDAMELLFNSKSDGVKATASKTLVVLGNRKAVEKLFEFINSAGSDELTYSFCIDLISKLVMGQKTSYLDRVAASSNYTCEFPIVSYLLESGI